MMAKRYRSLLFLPASRLDLVERAHERGADAIIIDLEDGVANEDKVKARYSLGDLLEKLHFKGIDSLVRINSLNDGGLSDIDAIPDRFAPPLLLPKVTTAQQITEVAGYWKASGKHLSTLKLLPMIECPAGMFRAEQIATASECVSALVFGSEDFSAQANTSADIDALAMPAQWVALAASAAGIAAYGLPGSLGNYNDLDLFEATLGRAKTIGFTGSLCIHPKQVLLANKVFQPSAQDIQWAESVIDQSTSSGATGGSMGMIDAPVLARAQRILARS